MDIDLKLLRPVPGQQLCSPKLHVADHRWAADAGIRAGFTRSLPRLPQPPAEEQMALFTACAFYSLLYGVMGGGLLGLLLKSTFLPVLSSCGFSTKDIPMELVTFACSCFVFMLMYVFLAFAGAPETVRRGYLFLIATFAFFGLFIALGVGMLLRAKGII